jgi:two-component system cell cycle sensor histidine kinase/response regulator CckA
MKDEHKTKEQLINELVELRQRVAELEASEAERVQAEEELQENEEKYRTLVEHSLQGLVVVQDFGIVFANVAFAEISGYTVEELLSLSPEGVRAIIHPEDQALVWGRVRDRLTGEPVPPRYEYRGIRKDGSVRWLEMFASRIEYHGKPAVQGTIIDITERKRAEEALRESEERFRGVFENATIGLYRTTPDGRILMVNPALVHMLGYTSFEELAQRNLKEEGFEPEYPRSAFQQRIESEGQIIGLESAWVRRDGTTLFVRESARAIRDEAGNTLYYEGTLEDITERKRAEEAVARREAELHATLYSIGDAVISTSIEGRVARMNPVAEQLTSWAEAEAAGKPLDEVFHIVNGETRRQVENPVARILSEGVVVGLANHTLLIARDGTERPIADAGAPILDKDGKITGVVLVFRDQTEQRRAQRIQRQLAAIVESSFDAIISKTLDGTVVSWNKAAEQVYGYTAEEMMGRSISMLAPPDHVVEISQLLERIRRGEQVETLETVRVRKDGQRIHVALSISPIKDAAGAIVGASTIARDITARKRAEEALRESEERYRALYEDNPTMYLTVDAEGTVLSVNQLGAEQLGYTVEELVGQPVLNVFYEDDKEAVREHLVTRLQNPTQVAHWEFRKVRKDGSMLWVKEAARAVQGTDGNPVVLIACEDITERKQLEAQLRQAQKMEAIGQLASGIAHDFNNLLTSIGGFTELLLREALEGSQQYRDLHQVKVAAERAAALTRQLRLFTHQEKGERRPTQLNSVVEETRDLLEHSIPKEITIELHLEPGLWAVEADPSQMSQVLMNLCVNARDAMADGGTLTLETRNVTLGAERAQAILAAPPGRYVCLSVSDTGCGMSPEVQARLFEPFFTTKEVGRGTGLGLAVVYGIVRGHEGFITVYSEEGQGSTFRVYLPAIALAVEESEVEVSELPTGTEVILLVDDEGAVRKLGQRILEGCGYTVLMAEDGFQALEVYQAHQGEIALVVLDVVMPQMGGRECLRQLRQSDPQVRVLISTGYTARSLAKELVAEGVLGVVEKPFRIRDFATAVRAALDEL